MINFFKQIFSTRKNETTKQNSEPLTENNLLDILSNAISDVGYWSWWTTNLPSLIQIEFDGTQLYFSQKDDTKPPSSQIAIQFINPKSISFLSRQRGKSENKDNWFELLHDDKIKPPRCSSEYFTFTDNNLMKEIIEEAKKITTIFGYSPKDNLYRTEKYKLAFWAGDLGFAVSSDELNVITKDGKVELHQIPKINSLWWEYWKKYWESKNTKNPLPQDYACEVTIPIKR